MKKVKTVVIILAVISLPMLSSLAIAAKYTFIPRLDVDSYYTDNVDLTPTDTESAFVTTVVPGFTAGVSGRPPDSMSDLIPVTPFTPIIATRTTGELMPASIASLILLSTSNLQLRTVTILRKIRILIS